MVSEVFNHTSFTHEGFAMVHTSIRLHNEYVERQDIEQFTMNERCIGLWKINPATICSDTAFLYATYSKKTKVIMMTMMPLVTF